MTFQFASDAEESYYVELDTNSRNINAYLVYNSYHNLLKIIQYDHDTNTLMEYPIGNSGSNKIKNVQKVYESDNFNNDDYEDEKLPIYFRYA